MLEIEYNQTPRSRLPNTMKTVNHHSQLQHQSIASRYPFLQRPQIRSAWDWTPLRSSPAPAPAPVHCKQKIVSKPTASPLYSNLDLSTISSPHSSCLWPFSSFKYLASLAPFITLDVLHLASPGAPRSSPPLVWRFSTATAPFSPSYRHSPKASGAY